MVYIKRISIKNFKSLGGSANLKFQPGFNVITGPNGSGKSNIIDAIQFVFGELGSRRMRVSDLSSLIFDGVDENGTNRATIAGVTLYFDNSDRGIAIDKKTVSVGRKIDRQGRSKYYLNGRRGSRRNVLDILEMAGITPGGYNIVLQGTATRLSDLMPSERMNALESLIGLTEYDQKKAEAKVRLTEAERKIEVASARIDEVRKRVDELERERNDVIKHNFLVKEEFKLRAVKHSYQLSQLESMMKELEEEVAVKERETIKLEETRRELIEARKAARAHLEEFNKEASEKGNTRLPILKSEFVSKETLKESLELRIREIENRKKSIQKGISDKISEMEESEKEIEEKQIDLLNLTSQEEQIKFEIENKENHVRELDEKISLLKESTENNQKKIEDLTESLIPMQDSMSGFEIEINRHQINANNLNGKIDDLEQKKTETAKAIESLKETRSLFQNLKLEEAQKLEEMLETIEEQIKNQKSLRSTMENANRLAKEAETTITQFTAKRDLWKKIVINEKAQERIKEMGEAGALSGYHGTLRSLLKIDLKFQRAAKTSSRGWINAIVVDDIPTALDCVKRLKKSKLGMIRFLPLKNVKKIDFIPSLKHEGLVGYLPNIIRYDEKYSPAVNLVWGDTFIVKDRGAALKVSGEGYRAVTLSGDVYEAEGGIIGGYYRRSPNLSKLIPSEASVKTLSETIRTLRTRLRKRMGDLKLSGANLRKFTSYLDQSNKTTESIDEQIKETDDNIERFDNKIDAIDEKIRNVSMELEKELGLIGTLQERKEKMALEIDRVKAVIGDLKDIKPSDVTVLEINQSELKRDLITLRERYSGIHTDISVETNLIENYLALRLKESEGQLEGFREEIESLENEHAKTIEEIQKLSSEIEELNKALDKMTSEVESSNEIMQLHQKTLNKINQQIEHLDGRHNTLGTKKMELNVELEKLRIRCEQKLDELKELGFDDKLKTDGINIEDLERILSSIRENKSSLGAINQLAVEQYAQVVGNYKQLSVRINELEEEKSSILQFIDEVEQEKQTHFMEAFNEVCENFSNIFARLTGGGDGRLELQKPEKPFSGGVDLYIQFPGKPMRLASGASGGERSVAATAYLLAIQRFLKAPFYLLDEVDAHLDDLNVSRLAGVLRDNAMESQFIVVTLKDVMVHNADRIYGVFNQSGKSRVLSLPVKMEVPL